MELGEIFSDALTYPFNNIKALILYIILGIIVGICIGGAAFGAGFGIVSENDLTTAGSLIVGFIIAFIIELVIMGYTLDIIKFGINRDSSAPGIEFVNQFIKGIKLIILTIVYFIIPTIIGVILAMIFNDRISFVVITTIIFIIFALVAIMGECRLAKTNSLRNGLSIREAINDISRIGIIKLLAFIIIITIISAILSTIVGLIGQLNDIVGGILLGILEIYITFFVARATGLLYSDV